MIFVPLFHPSRTAAAALPILVFFSVLRPLSANVRNEPRGLRLACLFFYFKTSLALSRNFLKFPIHLCPTRVNFSTASSTTLPHPVEGAALLRGRLSPSFSVFLFDRAFSVFSERFFNRLRPKTRIRFQRLVPIQPITSPIKPRPEI